MSRIVPVLLALVFFLGSVVVPAAESAPAARGNPVVVVETSLGTFEAELFADKAPQTVANFLAYVKEKFYDGTVFHRVISKFMIQGGGFTPDLHEKEAHAPIRNEAANGLRNVAGTLAMARMDKPDTAASEFFINVVDNPGLNHRNNTDAGFGYCVFGRVTNGMDVVNKIRDVKTHNAKGVIQGQEADMGDVPIETVKIISIRLKEAAAK